MAIKARASKFVIAVGISLAIAGTVGCATMHKPGETAESKAQDRYACEKDAYDSHAQGLQLNGMYRDCMHARGYQ